MSLQARGFSARVDQVYPPDRWDEASCQLRCSHSCPGIEGLFILQLTEPFLRIYPLIGRRPFMSLLLGRSWGSEDQRVHPWCRLVHDSEIRDLARQYSHYQADETLMRSDPDLRPEHLLNLGHGYGLKASVQLRKVSSVMYFIVCLEPRVPGLEKNELSILRDDESD